MHTSPVHPLPRRQTFDNVGDRHIENAIEGLEEMVEEAVELAEVSANDQVNEIYDIIEGARTAVQETSTRPQQRVVHLTSRHVEEYRGAD